MHPVPLHIPQAVSPYITLLWSGRPQGTHMGPLKHFFSKSRKSTSRLGFWTFSFILAQSGPCRQASDSQYDQRNFDKKWKHRVYDVLFKVEKYLFMKLSSNNALGLDMSCSIMEHLFCRPCWQASGSQYDQRNFDKRVKTWTWYMSSSKQKNTHSWGDHQMKLFE